MKIYRISFFLIFITLSYGAHRAPVEAENGMVVSASSLASQSGVDIMKKGGNAVDAAVATGFALAVTHPQAGNIGGGGFMVIHTADGKSHTIDFREKAPLQAHHDMYLDDSSQVIPDLSLFSHLAAGVPGSVHGLLTAWKLYGSGNISRNEILAPAIQLAQRGFILSTGMAAYLNYFRDFFQKDDGARRVFIRTDNKPWKSGDRFKQPELANTLRRIARNGITGFYGGKTADLIVAEMEEGQGMISRDDLALYESKERPPVIGTFRDYEIISMGPPSSGGALLIQLFNMLEHYPLDTLGWNSSEYIHILTECERLAYADRAEHMGDADFWDVPLDMLIDKDYAAERIQLISTEHATPSAHILAGNPTAYESRETTHYSVIDAQGNAVSVTTTLNTSFGCGVLVEGAGFFLNNEMDDFSVKPGVPNVFGLIGKEANAIEPEKRPLSSMTPTIILKDGKPFMVIGSPGGSTIITTTMQCILNVVVHGMNIQQAVSVPRVHSQWLPDVIMTEPFGLAKDVRRNLEARGHKIIPYRWGHIGQANGILLQDGMIYGGADERGENTAIGY
ncbi:MAG: gamma-glutamyltransferase [Fidelibacterota bacterium]